MKYVIKTWKTGGKSADTEVSDFLLSADSDIQSFLGFPKLFSGQLFGSRADFPKLFSGLVLGAA